MGRIRGQFINGISTGAAEGAVRKNGGANPCR